MSNETNRESRVRKRAARRGYTVSKARGGEHLDNLGLYMLVEHGTGVVLGTRFDARLDDIEAFLNEGE